MPVRTAEVVQRTTTVRGHDGLRLAATAVLPAGEPRCTALLLHGEGADRDQGGFYVRLAAELAGLGVASLRVDLPGHGDSEGTQEELSLSGLLNVISASLTHLRDHEGPGPAMLLATGLTGGVAAGYAARRADEVAKVVLFNPLIDYQEHFADANPAWSGGFLGTEAGRALLADGHLRVSDTFVVGRAMLNEVFWLQPRGVLPVITAPTLVVHGAGPTDVPASSSRSAVEALTCPSRLVEIAPPVDAHWQAPAIRVTTEWLLGSH
ncbi:Lysophospholipase, alpha-beta hydrolase superfamily [Lentzea waywayandensis]|uniref:Lysophospholipase, alpha-beta hydrolase superfamily n=1 Tax=Lentzea waywayandensis TaxID=84724 RepID=A0A1I6DE41_9PSEU|nr:alpha/beta fold hydrolase [Lentzea waywayandensis]SFR03706.1 Lysophospholipase, alpha-beta hydrolase superfamily [Lentzea waywayandensis]